jgi:hypothetical protein
MTRSSVAALLRRPFPQPAWGHRYLVPGATAFTPWPPAPDPNRPRDVHGELDDLQERVALLEQKAKRRKASA